MGTKNNDQKIKDVCNVFTMYKLTGGGLRKIEPAGMLPLYSRVYAFAPGMDKTQYAVIDDKNNLVKMSKNYDGDYFGPFKKFETHNDPVSKKFGIGFYWDDLEPDFRFDAAAVKKAIIDGKNFENQMELKAAQIADADKEERARLKNEMTHLTINEGNDQKTTKLNLIADLKLNFPGVKFSVRKEDYSTYYIRWENGPADDDVSKITDKYQDHHSDELTGDYWDYDPTNFNRVFGGFKFVMTSRGFCEKINDLHKDCNNILKFSGYGRDSHQIIGQIIRRSTIPANFETVQILQNNIDCGSIEKMYDLVFDAVPEPTKEQPEPEPTKEQPEPEPTKEQPEPEPTKEQPAALNSFVQNFYNNINDATAKKLFFEYTTGLQNARCIVSGPDDPAHSCGLADLLILNFKCHKSTAAILTAFLKFPKNTTPENGPGTGTTPTTKKSVQKTEPVTKMTPAPAAPGIIKNTINNIKKIIECKSNFDELNLTMPLKDDGVKLLTMLRKRYQLLLKKYSYPENHFMKIEIV
jgi:hypothetical protein